MHGSGPVFLDDYLVGPVMHLMYLGYASSQPYFVSAVLGGETIMTATLQ